MPYGLDLTECHFLTDHNGNRLRADIPYSMFAMLVEFRSAALRAQTRQIENSGQLGNFRGALSVVPRANEKRNTVSAAVNFPERDGKRSSSSARERLEAMFAAPPLASDLADTVPVTPEAVLGNTGGSAAKAAPKRVQQVYFPRFFRDPIPDEVGRMIAEGIYFLRTWRLYRNYSKEDAADLANITTYTICRHEHGYNQPATETIERFANIYCCSVNQLTALAGSNTRPFNPAESSLLK